MPWMWMSLALFMTTMAWVLMSPLHCSAWWHDLTGIQHGRKLKRMLKISPGAPVAELGLPAFVPQVMQSLTDRPMQGGETFKKIRYIFQLVFKSLHAVFVAAVSVLLLAFVLGVHQAGRDGGTYFSAALLILVA